jgi:hypothetical protein
MVVKEVVYTHREWVGGHREVFILVYDKNFRVFVEMVCGEMKRNFSKAEFLKVCQMFQSVFPEYKFSARNCLELEVL